MEAILRAMLAVLLLSAAVGGVRCAEGAERPHIVLFLSDDHGYLDSTVAGSKDAITPNLERLARDGVTFTHAFAASPACAPSRAALLTGLMPMRNGAIFNHQPPKADIKKWPTYFQELGYEVVAFGKVAHYKQGKDYGFDLVAHDTFHDHQCVDAALKYLENRDDPRPLCLCVGTNWPHVPWPAEKERSDPNALTIPPNHVDTPSTREWRVRYLAAVERFDRDLGKVYEAAYQKLGNSTVFVHASDHGAQWPFGKWNLYDDGTRVPFFVVWPGVSPAGRQSEAMISLVDVLPTLIEVAGGVPPSEFDGRSFAAVVRGDSQTHRDAIYTTHSRDGQMNMYPMRSVRTSKWKYIRNLNPHAVVTTHIDKGKPVDGSDYWSSWKELAKTDDAAQFKVERYHHRPEEELYDLKADPFEQSNLAELPRHSQELGSLRTKLDDWMSQQKDAGLATERVEADSFYRQRPSGK